MAERFAVRDRIFLAGDACHIHSVNGGQGLNTGLADAFNLMWKIHMVLRHGAPTALLGTYEAERKPIALSVVETSGELVRSTKFSKDGTHADDYVKIVQRHAGNITGMGIRYAEQGLAGTRLHDFMVNTDHGLTRAYSLLDYARFTLFVFGESQRELALPAYVQEVRVRAVGSPYTNQALMVRPDGYISGAVPLDEVASLLASPWPSA